MTLLEPRERYVQIIKRLVRFPPTDAKVQYRGGKRRGNALENLRSMERKIQNRLIIARCAVNKKAAGSPRRPHIHNLTGYDDAAVWEA
jgi:hypothetical protein